ncbi:F-box only protein 41-like [Styela clava]
MTDLDKAPYRCQNCKELDKRFKSLVGLRLHAAIAHSEFDDSYPRTKLKDLYIPGQTEEILLLDTAQKSRSVMMESNVLNDIPSSIDKIFEKYNKKAEMLLQKYDRNFSEIEEELRLSGKLRLIRKQKERLRANSSKWNEFKRIRNPVHKEEQYEVLRSDSDNEQKKDKFTEKESKHIQTSINNSSAIQETETRRKLDLSIHLAAKYKEQAVNLERKLHEVSRSENEMRNYLHQAAQQEAVAKQRLEDFITGLLERAETAEEKLKVYKNQLKNSTQRPRQSRLDSSSPASTNVNTYLKPPQPRPYSSSAPTTPQQPARRVSRLQANSNDNYVAQFLEPPSSQELPRRWNKRKDNTVDQLPGIDLSNVIEKSTIWPFANTHTPSQTSSSERSTAIGHSPTSTIQHFDSDDAIRRRIVLFCVFAYLDTESLLRCSIVCREWRDVSKHPKLWTRVSLDAKQISSQFLSTLSAWCKETCYISLSNIEGRKRYLGETSKDYKVATAGSLEDGMECLLQACGNNLLVLSISKCDPFLTRRVLWMASCYNRELRSITFRSWEPLNQEVTWSLGAGCRKLLSLDVAPLKSCKSPQIFNNKVLQMISWCWPTLRGLSIGGRCIDKKGLLSIATSCQNLQVLELMYMDEITEDLAKELVKHGFGSLRSLMLTHTPIRTRALACLLRLSSEQNLDSLRVHLSFSDYCPTKSSRPMVILNDDMDRSELFQAFNSVMQSLMRLQKKNSNVLQVICTA